jgi:hypothetical protein
MQSILLVLDFSAQPLSPNFKGQAGDFLTMKIGPTVCAETSDNLTTDLHHLEVRRSHLELS